MRSVTTPLTAALVGVVALLAPAPSPAGAVTAAYTATGRVSVTSSGGQVAQSVGSVVATSADGRFVAFDTSASLAPTDGDGHYDVYLRDRLGGTTRQVSLADDGSGIDGPARTCALSRDGRYVAFVADADELPGIDDQIYVRDRLLASTTIVSVSSAEVPSSASDQESGINGGDRCAISDDGRYVAFQSEDDGLAPGASTHRNVYRRDRQGGSTALVSGALSGTAAGDSGDVAISAAGTIVAFTSDAENLVAGDTNGDTDVFVRTFPAGTTARVSTKAGGAQVEGSSYDPSITADGTRVAFTSASEGLAGGDGNGYPDVYVRNRQADTVVRASLGSSGELGSGGYDGEISDDGRYVSFTYYTPATIPGDANGAQDVLRRDLQAGATQYASVARNGSAGNQGIQGHEISGDGTVVAFTTQASDLVRGDTNESLDVFVRDWSVATTPFATRAALVERQYEDFIGRAPTSSEKATWEARFSHGEAVPEQLVDELAHSTTWAGKRAPVIRLYWAFFLRVPDKAGMQYWIGEATKGLSLPKMASKFAKSQEFTTKYGPLANGPFVTKVYENVFGRSPEPAGLAYWKGQLDSGAKTRGDVMVGFSESAEGRLLIAPATDSVLVWLAMMDQMPPASWSLGAIGDAYASGEPPEIIPRSILATAAYAQKVAA